MNKETRTNPPADSPAETKPDLLGGRMSLVARHRLVIGGREKPVDPGESFEIDAKGGARLLKLGAAEDEAPRRKAKKGADGA